MKIFAILLAVIISDSISKYWTNTQMPNISLIGDWVKIVFFKNTGIAFSTPLYGIHVIIPLILGGILGYMIISWKKLSQTEKIGYLLIFTGGSLNAIERSMFGYVTDMISIQYFAVFNIADLSVTAGVVLLLMTNILSSKNSK